MSKFTKMFLGGFIISKCRRYLICEHSDGDRLTLNRDASPILATIFPKGNALESRCASSLGSLIGLILPALGRPKINSSVVKGVIIDVVALICSFAHTMKNFSMHRNVFAAVHSSGIERLSEVTPMCKPTPLIKKLVINGINYCCLAFSEGNQAYTGVERLDNFVTLHGGLHYSTSNGIVRQFSRAFILACLTLAAATAGAQTNAPSAPMWCQAGNQTVTTQGMQSTNKVQGSFPSCRVTVYNHGTTNLTSPLYATDCTTTISNPFTATTSGLFQFCALESTSYDVVTSGTGMPTTTYTAVAVGFDAHSPGPIGDVTPSTIGATAVTADSLNGIILVNGSNYACDSTGLNAALTAAGLGGTVDARSCTGSRVAADTIDLNGRTLLLGSANWTMSGCPNINFHGNGAALIGPTASPIITTRLFNNTTNCASIEVTDTIGFEIGNLDLEVATGVVRTTVVSSTAAGIHGGYGTTSSGHGMIHDMNINVAPYGILLDNKHASLGVFNNIRMGGYAPNNVQGIIADIRIYINNDTDLFVGATIASLQFNGLLINNQSPGGAPSAAAIWLGDGIDTLEMNNVDIGHVPGDPWTGFLMTDEYSALHPGSGGRAARFSRFNNVSVEGNGLPACIIKGARETSFNNFSCASGSQGPSGTTVFAEHTLVIDNTEGGFIGGVNFTNSAFNSGSTKEAVYIHNEVDPNIPTLSGVTFTASRIGDGSAGNPSVYCDALIDANTSNVTFNGNIFHHIFTTTTPACSIKLAGGTSTQNTVVNNLLIDGSISGCMNSSDPTLKFVGWGNTGVGDSCNQINTSSQNYVVNTPQLIVGGAYNGLLNLKNVLGHSAAITMSGTAASDMQIVLPDHNCSAGNVFTWVSPSLPMNCTKGVTVATPTVGQAACIYAAGPPVQIGKCTTVVDAAGACTCAP